MTNSFWPWIDQSLSLDFNDKIIIFLFFPLSFIFRSQDRKSRSNYRRPSSLGLATTPLPDKSEAKIQFKPMPASRSHIVAPLKDHLKPEGALEKVSEVKANYRNLSPSRPVIHKLKDHLKVTNFCLFFKIAIYSFLQICLFLQSLL